MTPANLPLVHLVREGDGSVARPPMLMLLHGLGSNEHDLFSFADYLDPRSVVICARAPHAYGYGGYSWFDLSIHPDRIDANEPQVEASLRTLVSFVQEAITAYGADPERVLLGGFSQGGFMSLLAGLSRPELFCGLVSMSGCLTPAVQPLFATPGRLQGLPVLMTHGTRDPIIPIKLARETRDMLQPLPVELEYEEFDMVHEVTMPSLERVLLWVADRLGERN